MRTPQQDAQRQRAVVFALLFLIMMGFVVLYHVTPARQETSQR